jgi:peptidylprolyl isomerase
VRFRPVAVITVAAAALVLTGCAGSPEPAPPGTAASLCDAVAPAGAASDAVQVSGEVGARPEAVFTTPLTVDDVQSTVVVDGSGERVDSGEFVTYTVTAFDAQNGAMVDSAGYGPGEILPSQISPDSVLGKVLGCATVGTRVAAALPATGSSAAAVYVIDLLGITPTAAWGEPQAPRPGAPEVRLQDDGAPVIDVPAGDPPSEVVVDVLKRGDGAMVESGDSVLVQYTGARWSDGSVFDSSWDRGTPASFVTPQVVDGFRRALEGQTVGSQVLVVVPPAFGYGASEGNELQNETLVFVVDILGTQHPVTAQG